MGTKNNPAPNDCYDRAEPDEPMFTLLARDPTGATLVSIWAKLRVGQFDAAESEFQGLKHALQSMNRRFYDQEHDIAKAHEAQVCATAMDDWIHKNRPGRALTRRQT